MYIILFLSDGFVWEKETSLVVLNYFKKYIGFNEAIVYFENEKFIDKIQEVINFYKIYNENVYAKKYIRKNEEDYKYLISNSVLLLIDENLKKEIAYKYISYDYKGKFKYI